MKIFKANRLITIAIILGMLISIGMNIYFFNKSQSNSESKKELNIANEILINENEKLNEHIGELMKKLELHNDPGVQGDSDPNFYANLSEDDLKKFSTREIFILNRWNQLANSKSDLGFWGVSIGDDIYSVLGWSNDYTSMYRFADENMGEEGIEITMDNMDIFFVGTRVKSIFVHYYAGDDDRYKVEDINLLYRLVEEDYSDYKVELVDNIIIVTDEINDVKMKFIYFDDALAISIEHTERFELE